MNSEDLQVYIDGVPAGGGDELQEIKKGILELADVIAIS